MRRRGWSFRRGRRWSVLGGCGGLSGELGGGRSGACIVHIAGVINIGDKKGKKGFGAGDWVFGACTSQSPYRT
jgi:hypothetical protein